MPRNTTDALKDALRNPHSLTPLVLLMGFIGASLRYILEMLLPAGGGFPTATLAVNIFGCFTLGIINLHIAQRSMLPTPLVKSMGIGLIGAFTTVSAFSVESLSFLQQGLYPTFALYLGATAVTTLAAAWAGKLVADMLGRRAERKKVQR
ncbi:MAG: CrcB family protein [Coriobacteriia bacterium]|nr:CrcB family protein [Coriobacteriia bacterium]